MYSAHNYSRIRCAQVLKLLVFLLLFIYSSHGMNSTIDNNNTIHNRTNETLTLFFSFGAPAILMCLFWQICLLIFFSRFQLLFEDRLFFIFCDFVELKFHESTMTCSAWEQIFQMLIKWIFCKIPTMNDERWTTNRIFIHEPPDYNSKQCGGIPIETMKQ